jgi:LysM repeat protein
MRTCAFVHVPNSPLQRPTPVKRSRFLLTASAVLGAHVLALMVLLIQGCQNESISTAQGQIAPSQAVTGPDVGLSSFASASSVAQTASVVARVSQSPNPAIGRPVAENAPAAAEAGVPSFTIYVAKPGDSLSRIAKRHGTSIKALRALNTLEHDRIAIGQKIRIPVPVHPAGGAA